MQVHLNASTSRNKVSIRPYCPRAPKTAEASSSNQDLSVETGAGVLSPEERARLLLSISIATEYLNHASVAAGFQEPPGRRRNSATDDQLSLSGPRTRPIRQMGRRRNSRSCSASEGGALRRRRMRAWKPRHIGERAKTGCFYMLGLLCKMGVFTPLWTAPPLETT